MSAGFDELRSRLERCARSIEAALETLPAGPEHAPRPTAGGELAAFELRGERFALASRFVRGEARRALPAPLPGAAAGCAGLVDLDGELLPVFDLGVLLGLRARAGAAPLVLPLGEGERAELLLAVDRADGGRAAGSAHPYPWPLDPDASALLGGLLEDGTVLLDGERLLADPRLGGNAA